MLFLLNVKKFSITVILHSKTFYLILIIKEENLDYLHILLKLLSFNLKIAKLCTFSW